MMRKYDLDWFSILQRDSFMCAVVTNVVVGQLFLDVMEGKE